MRETLDQLCNRHTADKGSVWHDFCRRYEPFLEPLRDQPINLLEVGIQFGCSARMWLDYFRNAQIYGVDIGKEHNVSDPRFHFEVGDQASHVFWSFWKHRYPKMHVIIDDAAHFPEYSAAQFNSLWDHLLPGGLYAIEDVCTWWDTHYHAQADRGLWLMELVAHLNAHGLDYGGKPDPIKNPQLTELARTMDSIHLSKHLCLIVKKAPPR